MPAEAEGIQRRLLAVLVAVALLGATVGLLEAAPSATVRADGHCLRLRAAPSTTAAIVTCLADGSTVTPLDGQAEADGYWWRRVQTVSGEIGWVASTFLVHSPVPGAGPSAFVTPPAGGTTAGIAGTTSIEAIIAEQPFAVASLTVLDIETQRVLTYTAGVPAFVNTLTNTTLEADDVVLVRSAGVDGRISDPGIADAPVASEGFAVPFRVPPRGGLTHGLAGTSNLEALIAAQPFAVESVAAWDVGQQRWLMYTAGVPALVNSLTSETLLPGAAVFMRRSATLPDPPPPVVEAPEPVVEAAGGLAAITYYYCTPGTETRGIGDGGGFCGAMRSGKVVYAGAASCSAMHLGQRFRIVGDPTERTYTCEDTGGGVGGNHRDIWFANSDEGYAWRNQVGSWAEIVIVE